jgi:hypothetical protein
MAEEKTPWASGELRGNGLSARMVSAVPAKERMRQIRSRFLIAVWPLLYRTPSEVSRTELETGDSPDSSLTHRRLRPARNGWLDAQLDPCAAARAGLVGGAFLFGDNGFEREAFDFFDEQLGFAVEGWTKENRRVESEAAKAFFAPFDGFTRHVPAVDVEQVEGVETEIGVWFGLASGVERRTTVIERDDFAIDNHSVCRQLFESLAKLGTIEQFALSGKETDFRAILNGNGSAAVSLHLVEPLAGTRQFFYILA